MASVVLVLVGLAIFGLLAKLGWRLGGKDARWLGVALPVMGVLALPALIGWVLDQFGVVEPAVVADRRESIALRANGGWSSRYSIAIRFPGAGSAAMVRLRADQSTYDALHFGDPVEVRSLPIGRSLVRLEKMPRSGWIRSAAALEGVGIAGAAVAVVLGLTLIGGQGRAGLARGAFAVALLGFGGRSGYRQVRPYQGEVEPTGPIMVARGTVLNIWRVGELYGGIGLAQPYFLVATEFTPTGVRSSVRGIDAIDVGSVASLQVGDQIDVRYSSGSPRRVRLGFGTRTFGTKNQGATRITLGLVIVCLVGMATLRWWMSTSRRRSA